MRVPVEWNRELEEPRCLCVALVPLSMCKVLRSALGSGCFCKYFSKSVFVFFFFSYLRPFKKGKEQNETDFNILDIAWNFADDSCLWRGPHL